ncbi:MAG: hypothetical protein JWM91_2950 [Rhodospirillales bacterium]|nr:hypothetical protein [Rhodospirillales bacterium]
MEINPLVPQQGRQIVQSYGKGGFRVSDTGWSGAIIVFPTRTIAWDVAGLADLSVAAFAPVGEAADPPIELLLIGTGQRMALLSSKLRADLRALGFGIEIMDTGAACRTYNVLIGEERRVAAALLPVA